MLNVQRNMCKYENGDVAKATLLQVEKSFKFYAKKKKPNIIYKSIVIKVIQRYTVKRLLVKFVIV